MNNNEIIIYLLLLEKEEIMYNLNAYRKPRSNLIKTRENEGFFEVLINGHLKENTYNFCEFFD